MASTQAHFLVASPQLGDGNFFRSVVLMVEHNAQGAFGLIVNRRGNDKLASLADLMEVAQPECTDSIYVGGPVPGPLLALHTEEELGDTRILPELFVTSRREQIEGLLRRGDGRRRFFAGYSGWGKGQLDDELRRGGWLLTKATVEDVFSDDDTLWERLTRRINLEILAPVFAADGVPHDPGLN